MTKLNKKRNAKAIKPDFLLYSDMADEIWPNLWVGGRGDAQSWEGNSIYVHEMPWPGKPYQMEWIPFLRYDPLKKMEWADMNDLYHIATRIDYYLSQNAPLLVNCWAGSERSPLATAYYLVNYKGFTYRQAYALLQSRRPIVQDRTMWLT